MTLFVNTPKITDGEVEELFSAGMSLLSCKAFPAAYLCFNRIPNKDSGCCTTRRYVASW